MTVPLPQRGQIRVRFPTPRYDSSRHEQGAILFLPAGVSSTCQPEHRKPTITLTIPPLLSTSNIGVTITQSATIVQKKAQKEIEQKRGSPFGLTKKKSTQLTNTPPKDKPSCCRSGGYGGCDLFLGGFNSTSSYVSTTVISLPHPGQGFLFPRQAIPQLVHFHPTLLLAIKTSFPRIFLRYYFSTTNLPRRLPVGSNFWLL